MWKKQSVIGIYKMLTRNINQDPLENRFGWIRQLECKNINPTCALFEHSLKTLDMKNFSTQIHLIAIARMIWEQHHWILFVNFWHLKKKNTISATNLKNIQHLLLKYQDILKDKSVSCVRGELVGLVNSSMLVLKF